MVYCACLESMCAKSTPGSNPGFSEPSAMSDSHQVLFRKYRPQLFQDVIYQDLAVGALQNAIRAKKVGHAYIFIGPRGVGKTTIARVLAKRLNCENPNGNEPCNQCSSCLEIIKGVSGDVVEIDAASHNGVDHIRELRENVKFNALGGKYRVFILDEVHMLSTAAFNALLKTLEEPPPHVVFILATTEHHKIPETILSRCQDFIFKKVPESNLQEYVELICKKENLEFDSEGLFWIAKKGDGSVRDTLSFMEQAVIFTDGKLLGSKIRKMIGYHGIEIYSDILSNLLDAQNSHKVFTKIENLYLEGMDLQKVLWDFVEFLNALLLLKDQLADRESIRIPQEDLLKMKSEFREVRKESIVLIADRIFTIHERLNQMKLRSSFEIKVYLEIQFRKLILEIEKPSVAALVTKLSEFSKLLQGDLPFLPEKRAESPTVQIAEKPVQPKEDSKSEAQQIMETEKLLKEKFSGVEVDPAQFKNL